MHNFIDYIYCCIIVVIYSDYFSRLWCRHLNTFSESFIVWQRIGDYQLRKNSCIRPAIEITLYFIFWWRAELRRRKIEIREEKKIKSVKFTSSIKRKINVGSCVHPRRSSSRFRVLPHIRGNGKITYLWFPRSVKED